MTPNQCTRHIFLFCYVAFFSLCPRSFAENGFNSVLSKTIDANVTCGDPREIYYRTQEGVLHPRLRNRLVCDASDPKNAHPPENMIDGDLATFWQSKASVDKAEIRINLNQEFFGYAITVTFGDYRRPEHIAFRKSEDYGVTFEPWHFLVSPPAMDQCREVFNMDVTSRPQQVETVVCQQYPNYSPLEYNETFTIDMNGRQRGDGSSDSEYYSPEILSWMKITNLEIIFTGLYQKFDRLSTAWMARGVLLISDSSKKFVNSSHHYAVGQIGLTAKCNCNGYADGFDCPLNPVNKQRECKCKGNTCGVYCEICCPAFNQYPWQQGNGPPWVWNGTATCEACDCHNHSDVCVYNQTVAAGGLSLDVNGQRKGGGVCINCKDNTEGINCEKCKKHFYRPLNQSKNSPDACKECRCNVAGTLNLPNMTFLDCVRDKLFHDGKQPGDCYCKKNVVGKTCTVCKDEFYFLHSNDAFGCKSCNCHLPGAVNRSNICEKDDLGQCPCKENTRGRNCAQCKSGFYNLRNEAIGGCEDCGCDPGAVVPGTFCNNVTGNCECFAHIYGQQCKSIEAGCYYPNLHFISAEKDIYAAATPMLSVLLDVPKDGYFRIMINYILKISDSADVDVQFISSFDHMLVNSTSTTFSKCTTMCYHRLSPSFFYLSKGEVRVMINSSREDLKLYKVVAIPREFFIDTVLGARASLHFQFQCNIDDNDMRIGTNLEEFCLSNVYSLTIAYNKGPFNCSCHPIGSYNSTRCDPYGEQCHCKPGVTGPYCSQCLPEFYNISNTGCTACDCRGENKLCNVTTGWCECPRNTALRTCEPCKCNNNSDSCLRNGKCLDCKSNSTGFHCERCSNGTYGNATTADCKDCKCHKTGSMHSVCDVTTGQCPCTTNVVGRNCSQCSVNTYKMSGDGCLECQCNSYGSSSLECNETGQCPCHANVTGQKCTQCVVGYYGLPKKACQACGCSRTGSVSGTVCTNDELGLCTCKPGVSGRACDSCRKQYTDFTSSGCSRCPACPRNLQSVLGTVMVKFDNVSRDVLVLKHLGSTDRLFQKTTKRLEMAKLSSDQYSSRIAEGKRQCQALLNSSTVDFASINSTVTYKNKKLQNDAIILETENKNALEKVSDIEDKTTTSKNFTESIHEFLKSMTTAFSNLTESTIETVDKAQNLYLHLSNVTFKKEIKVVEQTLKKARNLSRVVGNVSNEVASQDALERALEISMDKAMESLLKTQNESEKNHDLFVDMIRNIFGSFSSASALVENIKNINKESKTLIEKAKEILKYNDDILDEAQQNVEKAQGIYQKYKDAIIPVQGEVEISMLQYDFTESVFLMKILQARDLLGRDIPSGSSDPYAVISIMPAWRGQGSQKSRIINGTTSPVFPLFDIFRFNINEEEIHETKVIITLYDYDADDVDDCLGEVVIDLVADEFFNRIVTKWFKVKPKGTTNLNSGNFNADGIGLIDMNTLLQIQINEFEPKLNVTKSKLAKAKMNVTNLQNIVDSLNRSLQQAFTYARRPLETITRYETVSQMINDVVKQANTSRVAVDSLMEFLNQRSVEDINEDFDRAYKEIQEFHQTTLLRNLTPPTYLETAISTANDTFMSALRLWYLIDVYFPDLQAKTSQFQDESLKDSSIRRLTSLASNISRISFAKIKRLTSECEKLAAKLDVMAGKIAEVVSASANQSKIINEAVSYITEAESKLNSTPNPSENVLAALPIQENFEQTREGVSRRIVVLEEKVNRLMNVSRTFNLAMRFMGDGGVAFTPSELFLQNKLSDEIVFDLKTNTSRGGVIYVITSRDDLNQSIRIYLDAGKLCSTTELGRGPNTICHPERVDSGNWYRVLFVRYGTYYSLTVIGSDGQYTSVNASSTQEIREASYNEDTTIYLGGLPSGILPGVVSDYGYYNGVIDHLRIKTDRLFLWNSQRNYGQQLYHSKRIFPKHPPGPIYEASFFGTGSLSHKMGNFTINATRVAVQFQFRTLHDSGVLLEVLNTSKVPLFAVYIYQGSIQGVFSMASSEKITLSSTQSSYADGKWHRVNFNVTVNTAVLQIKTADSGTQDVRSVPLPGARSSQGGSILVFGGTNTNSTTRLLTRIPFAGDIKNIWLSSGDASEELIKRDLVGMEWIKGRGVSYEGIIKEKIYSGYRFYGSLPYKGHGSYAVVTATESEPVSHFDFTFKTTEKNGVLVYSTSKNTSGESTFFYMALWSGYLYVSYQDGDFKNIVAPFYYENETLTNNRWYSVSLNFTNARFHLKLNGKTIHAKWFGNSRSPLVLGRLFFVGGVDPKVPIVMPVPVYWSFQGDFQVFSVNSRELNLLSGKSEGVSRGGVSPPVLPPVSTTVRPTTTPTPGPQCKSTPGRPQLSDDIGSLRFGASSYEYNSTNSSYVGFSLNEKLNFFKSSMVVTLEMRSLTMNGLIFYAADSETDPKNFISLELVNGRLRFQFSSATGQVTILTTRRYALDGVWYKMYLLRIFQFGAIVIPSTKEYHNNRHGNAASVITLSTPFYIGGLPSHVNASGLVNRKFGFVGCLRNFEISSSQEDISFDMTRPDFKGSSTGPCFHQLEPGAHFNGEAWMKFENVVLSKDFTISIRFRTHKRSGLIFAVHNLEGRGLILQQKLGELVLNYVTTSQNVTLSWSPSSSNTSKDSFIICQMKWYTIEISRKDTFLHMLVNKAYEVTENVSVTDFTGSLALGKLTAENVRTVTASPFYGCLKQLVIYGVPVDLSRPSSQANTELSCPVD